MNRSKVLMIGVVLGVALLLLAGDFQAFYARWSADRDREPAIAGPSCELPPNVLSGPPPDEAAASPPADLATRGKLHHASGWGL